MEDISFQSAFRSTVAAITPLPAEVIPLDGALGRVLAGDLHSLVDVPSADVSLKDGYALQASDVARAREDNPVPLRLTGMIAAGSVPSGSVTGGTAVKVLSGALIPPGADAVLSREFGRERAEWIEARAGAEEGQNILFRGTDLALNQEVLRKGTRLGPLQVGLVAASGHARVTVHRSPRVSIIATGSEVIVPGERMGTGKVFASNLLSLAAWCSQYGLHVRASVIADDEESITSAIQASRETSDCIITSGGAWKGERDLVVRMLDTLGWNKVFHRVRMGPGKAVGFGLLEGKPVFCLPGGPPSNQMAFLQLALPGVLTLSGQSDPCLPSVTVLLGETVRGQRDWTQFLWGTLHRSEQETIFQPILNPSRLQSMARAGAILCIPEGVDCIEKGSWVDVHLLR